MGFAFKRYAPALAAWAICTTAAAAQAEPEMVAWPDEDYPVVVVDNGSLIFIDAQGQASRAFTWRSQPRGERRRAYYLVDMDQDGSPEVVGAGKPTFVLSSKSHAVWTHEEGCEQALVADFVADDRLDILCNNGRELKVYTHDGQFVWSLSLNRRLDHCRAGDWNGDLKADLECKYRGMDVWARVDSGGEVITAEAREQEIPTGAIDLAELEAVPASSLSEQAAASIDLGEAAKAAIVEQLDDGGVRAFVLKQDAIEVVRPDASSPVSYPTAASRYKRSPLAKLVSVYANNFGDDQNVVAQDAVKAAQSALSACYSERVRRNPFAGTGQMILQVRVDSKGSVKGVNKVHTDMTDDRILKCARRALSKVDYPRAAHGEDTTGEGTINVNINYTFVDAPK